MDRQALREAIRILEGGQVLAMLAEGTRSRTGQLQRGRAGVAFVALRTGAPILPVGLSGTEKFFPSLRRLRRPAIKVTIGQSFTLPIQIRGGRIPRQYLQEETEEIMWRIAALLPPEYRGVYRKCVVAPESLPARSERSSRRDER